MNDTPEKKKPSHRAYFVKPPAREGDQPDWIELGAAFDHADGKGFDVVLKVLPVGGFGGRITLRAIDDKAAV